jgi:hypothetical protein
MSKFMFTSLIVLTMLIQNVFASTLPEGAFRGTSDQMILSNNVMALLIQKDNQRPGIHYAVLAEYDRIFLKIPIPFKNTNDVSLGEKLAPVRWVPRMYIYQVEKFSDASDLKFILKPLKINESGEILVNNMARSSTLELKTSGSMVGAKLFRNNNNNQNSAQNEKISFGGALGERLVSTWENYVAGNYGGSVNKTGADYFSDFVNTVLNANGLATFDWLVNGAVEIQGTYQMTEALPKIFRFTPAAADNKSDAKMTSRIGVFIDIMNWKDWNKKTNELLLINPENPEDVGFFYERGQR